VRRQKKNQARRTNRGQQTGRPLLPTEPNRTEFLQCGMEISNFERRRRTRETHTEIDSRLRAEQLRTVQNGKRGSTRAAGTDYLAPLQGTERKSPRRWRDREDLEATAHVGENETRPKKNKAGNQSREPGTGIKLRESIREARADWRCPKTKKINSLRNITGANTGTRTDKIRSCPLSDTKDSTNPGR
jgi:hypothetical protein